MEPNGRDPMFAEAVSIALEQTCAFDKIGQRISLSSFVDQSAVLGEGVVIWHFARILRSAVLGHMVSIGSGAEVGIGSTIGDRSRISAGVFLPANSRIGNDVFIGPNATFTDDRYPKVLKPGESYTPEPPIVEDEARIGAGCVILPGVRIGARALIGAGSVVTKDVPPDAVVYGAAAVVR